MTTNDPLRLDTAALSTRLRELAGDERNIQVDFLLHLDAFDRKNGHLEAGYGSLWDFCLRALHLREGAAGRRIAAMRVIRRLPALEAPLRDGRLCLSTVALLASVLTEANMDEVVARASYKTKAEVDHLVASLQPRGVPKEGIRKLPRELPNPDPRAILAAVRREVWRRDGGCCTWTGSDGRRCGSRWKVEIDHVTPAAAGGAPVASNLRLLCARHNAFHAEQFYGRAHMVRFTRRGGATEDGRAYACCDPAPLSTPVPMGHDTPVPPSPQ